MVQVTPAYPMRARQRLVVRLRQLRGASSGQAFADRMGWGRNAQSKISKIERGAQLPTPSDLQAWAEASDGDLAELMSLLDRAGAEFAAIAEMYDDAGGPAARQALIGAEESAAHTIVMVQPNMIVPLLQTADYARAVIQPPPEFKADIPAAELTRTVAARLARQAILYEPGRDITLLMGEGALWDVVTDRAVHLRQLSHLSEQMESATHAKIGIVPFAVRSPFVTIGGYTMLDEVVSNETLGGTLDVTRPAAIAEYRVMTELLLTVAVVGSDAAELVRAISNRIDRPDGR